MILMRSYQILRNSVWQGEILWHPREFETEDNQD